MVSNSAPAPAAPAAPVAPPAGGPPVAAHPGGGAAPAAAPEVPWYGQIFDSATPGKLVENWHTKAPDPTKFLPYAGAKTVEDLLGGYEKRLTDAQTALRAKPTGTLPVKPAADAPPEHWKAYREAHGLPETPDGYQLTKPEGLASELWAEPKVKEFAAVAHSLDLKPDQLAGVLDWYHKGLQSEFSAANEQTAAQVAQLRQVESEKLAKAFGDNVDGTLKDMQAVVQAMGADPAIFDPASESFWGPDAAQLFHGLLKRVPRGEGQTMANMGAPTSTGNYDLAWAKAVATKGHPDYEAFSDPSHPRHKQVRELQNIAFAAAYGS
jgi:hypothetical protein